MSVREDFNSAELATFFQRHDRCTDSAFRSLLEAVKDEAVLPHRHTQGTKCSELASLYALRSRSAEQRGETQLAAEMKSFAGACRKNLSGTCDFWMFSGSAKSFVVFELQPGNQFAWCLKFAGPLSEPGKSAA
jgi:hypothetical protein